MAQRIYEPYEAKLYQKEPNTNTFSDIPIVFRCNIFDKTTAAAYQPVKGILSDNTKRVIYTTSKLDFKAQDKIEVNGMKLRITTIALGEDSIYSMNARKFSYDYLKTRLPKWMTLE